MIFQINIKIGFANVIYNKIIIININNNLEHFKYKYKEDN